MIHLLLVDDHLAFREPLAFMLAREPDIEVIGEAGSLAEARGSLLDATLVLVDLDLPDGDGATLIAELRTANPRASALVLSASADRLALARAVEAGAAGLLHKSSSVGDIVAALRGLDGGETLLSPTQTIDLLRLIGRKREGDRAAQAVINSLTPRERQVLQALADGLHDREISEKLLVSTETIRTHMVNLLRKLGVDSRLRALVFALRHNLVQME